MAFFAEGLSPLCNVVEDDATHFAAEAVFLALASGKLMSETNLRKTRTIKRRGVEVASAFRPSRVYGRGSFSIGDVAEHIPQRGCSESQRPIQQMFSDSHESPQRSIWDSRTETRFVGTDSPHCAHGSSQRLASRVPSNAARTTHPAADSSRRITGATTGGHVHTAMGSIQREKESSCQRVFRVKQL